MGFSKTIREVWERDPDGRCLEFEGTWRPWRTLSTTAGLLETLLLESGVAADAAIGLVARNRAGPVIALAALLGTARSVVMIHSAQSRESLAAEIRRLKLGAVVADEIDWTTETIESARAAGAVGLAATGDDVTPVERVDGLARLGPGPFRSPGPKLAVELLSSGTTGPPKRVQLTAAAFEQAAADAMKIYGASSDAPAPSLICHPISNIAGLTFLIPTLFCGQPTCVMERFELAAWLDAVRRHRPERASLPPALIRQILEEQIAPEAFSGFKAIGVGAARLDPELQDSFEARYGLPLLISYGATEFGGVIANWTAEMHQAFARPKRGSVGRARPGVELRVIDPDSGREHPPGKQGVLEARAERLGADWIRTTDLASIDADGFLYLHGRADQAINRGGFKVLPETVEAALRTHPAVRDVVVVGIADDRLGEIPVAAVELVSGAKIDHRDLMEHARASLLSYQAPVRILTVNVLPRNASMKVDLARVRQLFTEA